MKEVRAISTIRRSRWLAFASAGILGLSVAACSSELPVDANGNAGAVEDNATSANVVQDDTVDLTDPSVDEALDRGDPKDRKQPYGGPIVLTYLKDVAFIDFMVAHHRMGIEMDDNEIERGHREDVKQLAKKDKEERLRQIAVMLAERAKIADHTKAPPVVPDPKLEMDMKLLRSLSGHKLDELFLHELIPHHAPSIDVAHRSMPTLERRVIQTVAREVFEKQALAFVQVEILRGKFKCVAKDVTDK